MYKGISPHHLALYGTVPPFQDPGIPIETKVAPKHHSYVWEPQKTILSAVK